jgi:hypothetical protein
MLTPTETEPAPLCGSSMSVSADWMPFIVIPRKAMNPPGIESKRKFCPIVRFSDISLQTRGICFKRLADSLICVLPPFECLGGIGVLRLGLKSPKDLVCFFDNRKSDLFGLSKFLYLCVRKDRRDRSARQELGRCPDRVVESWLCSGRLDSLAAVPKAIRAPESHSEA